MSILLSAYFPEGIVFVADKNHPRTGPDAGPNDSRTSGANVLAWPNKKAIVGYYGLARLAGFPLDEWLRIFIAFNRDFSDIGRLAGQLRDQLQTDYCADVLSGAVVDQPLSLHLGGFVQKENVFGQKENGFAQKENGFVPVLYQIWNYPGACEPPSGSYPPGGSNFRLEQALAASFQSGANPPESPAQVRERLQALVDDRRYVWFSHGDNLSAFNAFRDALVTSLHSLQDEGFISPAQDIKARVAFCRMAVDLFGSYFLYHQFPEERGMGGNSEAVYIPWPEH